MTLFYLALTSLKRSSLFTCKGNGDWEGASNYVNDELPFLSPPPHQRVEGLFHTYQSVEGFFQPQQTQMFSPPTPGVTSTKLLLLKYT